MLQGRAAEVRAIERVLTRARDGHGGALVVRGEPGIGKTALLDAATEAAGGFRVLAASGVEFELELSFAGLHQLCLGLLDERRQLPSRQRLALEGALGLDEAEVADPFLVGGAVLGLLSQAAEKQPVLCVIDDAQWLDQGSAEAVGFLARRIDAEPIAVLVASRGDPARPELAGLPELAVGGLDDRAARALLAFQLHAPLDEGVRDRIVAEARGNPLALIELTQRTGPAELAGGYVVPEVESVTGLVEEGFRAQMRRLSPAARLFAVVAAAEPVGDPLLLWAAAELLGIDPDEAAPVEAAGLLEIDHRVRFRHPLVRSAVYGDAAPDERRRAHRALAEATDPAVDPDRRAWHFAQATPSPDETVATDLVGSADRARARGGVAAAAAFLELAATLTPDAGRRADRLLEAAHATLEAGAADHAVSLVRAAQMGQLDERQRASLEQLQARIAFNQHRGADAASLLVAAAQRLARVDPDLARLTYLEALDAAIHTGHLGAGVDITEVAEAARRAPRPSGPPAPLDVLLDGLATRFIDGFVAAAPMLHAALRTLAQQDIGSEQDVRHLWFASRLAMDMWNDELALALTTRLVGFARDRGAVSLLPVPLSNLAAHSILAGRFADAAAQIDEANSASIITRSEPFPHAALILVAWRGESARTRDTANTILREARSRQEGRVMAVVEYASAVLNNGLGRYEATLRDVAVLENHDHLGYTTVTQPEIVEAASRAGARPRGEAALEKVVERAQASGTPWALGMAARSRALLTHGPAAEDHYRQAIAHLEQCDMRTYLARAHLVYGEWLRRERRQRDSRRELRTAHDMFAAIGAKAFADRAARELRAAGERPTTAHPGTPDQLTSQELNVARRAAAGATSKEIAAELFISPRTVDAHLRNIFAKLGITTRRDLRGADLGPGV